MSKKSNVTPDLNNLLNLATTKAKTDLPAGEGHAAAHAVLASEVTTYGEDGNGTTTCTKQDARVELGTISCSKPAVKPCACECNGGCACKK